MLGPPWDRGPELVQDGARKADGGVSAVCEDDVMDRRTRRDRDSISSTSLSQGCGRGHYQTDISHRDV